MALVYDSLRLHITNDAFYIESLNAGSRDVLVIDRINCEIDLKSDQEDIPPSLAESKAIYGIFGIIQLVGGSYLIVITERVRVGDILGHTIWKVTKTEILPYRRSLLNLNEAQTSDNATYLSMLEHALSVESFYFSSSYDITHSMQRLATVDTGFHSESLSTRADPRFFWNRHALREFLERPELERFTTPIVQGFVSITSCFVKGRTFDLVLISRRSTLRAGTRYNVRGTDSNGNAANFVETEQMLLYARRICSIVQTRGSVPLLWSQKANLKYKPMVKIDDDKIKSMTSFNHHFDSQIVTYGKQIAINLVNHKGMELTLAKEFLGMVNDAKSKDLTYEAFDFHKECGLNKWDRLSILMDRIALDQEQLGYFMQDRDGKVYMKQTGVFRTNCMDCLDRTNVVQSLIARRSLLHQLVQLGIFSPGHTLEEEPNLNYLLKQVWADNADYCSKQYAGTGALKTDFTRTGKRTKLGLLKDGYNSAVRYYMNNFTDGFRQDSLDLLLGNFVVNQVASSPFPSLQQRRRPKALFITYLIFSAFLIFFLIPAAGFREQISYVIMWAAATFIVALYVTRHGVDFVNYPSLVHVKSKDD
ncbi:phosphatidylinositol-3-phosphatase SAC1-like [Clavelina lepadiformis]|uniref:phosphatidylinositol-3-phosphatase SAC1-like n=1 Tax=Clavelina lepadiformis TaxID=159417 RepID=UPI0040431112